ncbi:helicase [Penicillium samsonianum]|uniref:helicase n=1 Tax=Penicillium samsonianum TaxID=1882272 RepID=UPI0025477115|nr:helicase [Penicillium samsonianum]KAJ6150202.1 helicase [Penicillium samsonianum]
MANHQPAKFNKRPINRNEHHESDRFEPCFKKPRLKVHEEFCSPVQSSLGCRSVHIHQPSLCSSLSSGFESKPQNDSTPGADLSDAERVQEDRSRFNSEEVCYGSIRDVHVEIWGGPPEDLMSPCSGQNYKKHRQDFHIIEVLPGTEQFVVCVPSTDEMIGFINLEVSRVLRDLQCIGNIRLEIALTSLEWKALTESGYKKSSSKTVEISIFGSIGHIDDVSDVDMETEATDMRRGQVQPISMNANLSSGQPRAEELLNVLNNLGGHEHLRPIEPDKRLNVSLLP